MQHEATRKMQEWGNKNYEWGKQRVYRTSEKDTEVWEVLTDVPKLNGIWPYLCLILNIFIPGIGTMIAGCLGDPNSWSKTQIVVGLFQMLLAVYIIGWIWAIYWGYLLVTRSRKDNTEIKDFLDKTQAKSDQV